MPMHKKCRVCDALFTVRPSRFDKIHYCSRLCRDSQRSELQSGERNPNYRPLSERFWNRVRQGSASECWIWQGSTNTDGYGSVGYLGKTIGSHRAAYMLTHGDIADNMHVCHTCDNPPCCNPAHLFLGTREDNIQDRCIKGRSRGPSREAHANTKLSVTDLESIRDLYATGNYSYRKLASMFGVHYASIGKVIRSPSKGGNA